MKVFDATDIRNVALVGHSGSGKTQLAAALLYDTGATPRLGKVDEGTTVTDFDEEAIARKHTLSSSLAYFEFNKRKVNLIDTIEDCDAPDPSRAYRVQVIRETLAAAIERLPERERIVIGLYYYEGLTLKEIGEVLGVTESRVSQLHTKAVLRLRGRIKEDLDLEALAI